MPYDSFEYLRAYRRRPEVKERERLRMRQRRAQLKAEGKKTKKPETPEARAQRNLRAREKRAREKLEREIVQVIRPKPVSHELPMGLMNKKEMK